MKSTFKVVLLAVAIALVPSETPVQADSTVLLTVTGNVSPLPSHGIKLTFEDLQAIGTHTVVTRTKWTDGVVRFDGPLLRDVLAHVNAMGSDMLATAINDYSVSIPVADAKDYDVILAHSRDGKRMRIRDKGPLWVIYPWDQVPDLNDERIYARSVWQVNRLEVR